MHAKLSIVALSLASAVGCIVYTSDEPSGYEPPPPTYYNDAPWVIDAEAGVYWDNYYYDDIWYFEAVTDDPNGAYDVVEVWADVYDEYYGGQFVESFELFPTQDPTYWFSDWLGSSTYLDPFWGGYTVDIVAYDVYGDAAFITVWPYTY